jgi:hypothetical protein
MITRGLKELVGRDWEAVRRAKDRYWAERIARLGPMEAFRIGDELRKHALMLDPSWPRVEDRRADLEAHIRLAEVLRRADAARRR